MEKGEVELEEVEVKPIFSWHSLFLSIYFYYKNELPYTFDIQESSKSMSLN